MREQAPDGPRPVLDGVADVVVGDVGWFFEPDDKQEPIRPGVVDVVHATARGRAKGLRVRSGGELFKGLRRYRSPLGDPLLPVFYAFTDLYGPAPRDPKAPPTSYVSRWRSLFFFVGKPPFETCGACTGTGRRFVPGRGHFTGEACPSCSFPLGYNWIGWEIRGLRHR